MVRADHTRSRVPFEFVGRARVFCDRALSTNEPTLEAIKRIYGILAARARRSPIPRKELLVEAATAWRREIPDFGKLDRQIEIKRNSLRLVEVRIGGGAVRYPGWVRAEKGIGILLIQLRCAPGQCEMKSEIIGLVGLHALGRWMQRSVDETENALLRDLSALASQREQLLKHGDRLDDQSFVCYASGGAWVGQVVRMRSERTNTDTRVLGVRSFLNVPHGALPLAED
jgi:hypothetical protein